MLSLDSFDGLTDEERRDLARAIAWQDEEPDRELIRWAARIGEAALRWAVARKGSIPRYRMAEITRAIEPYMDMRRMIAVVEKIQTRPTGGAWLN
jgi:hypothetical protein